MALLKSTYARRKGTGRKPKHIVIRHKAVHTRRHRRFRGIHSQPTGAKQRNRAKALALVAKRRAARSIALRSPARIAILRTNARKAALLSVKKRVFKGRVFKGRVFKGRKVPPGLKRKFLGRKKLTYKRKVPPGLKRKFNGRKPSVKPKVRKVGTPAKPARGAAISPQSYINMF